MARSRQFLTRIERWHITTSFLYLTPYQLPAAKALANLHGNEGIWVLLQIQEKIKQVALQR